MNLSISALRAAYESGELTPEKVCAEIREQSAKYSDHNIWIHLLNEEEQAPYLKALKGRSAADKPLWGIPFAVKDNMDLSGIATTAACKDFAYVPEQTATVVARLIDAGAIPVGKTNMDQFATGLNGTRSPYGACANAFDADYISGGSSSGSAVSLALGLCAFSLGTDTAGSGRVPAAFNNLVGLKPTKGLLSTTGVVPACRSLDCVSIFALNCDDAAEVLKVAEGEDKTDPYSRPNTHINHARHYGVRQGAVTLGVIPESQLQFFGDDGYKAAYAKTLAALKIADGSIKVELKEIDYAPFDQAAKLLYEGPWVSERYIALGDFIKQSEKLEKVIYDIISQGEGPKATDLFSAQYKLMALKKTCDQALAGIDALLMPTAGRLFTREEMLANPIVHNSELGYYTNFMNLLDYAALAIPTTFTEAGLPFGVTLCSFAFSDRKLLSLARAMQPAFALETAGKATPLATNTAAPSNDAVTVDVLVCGAHLEGLPLNWQLQERAAFLYKKTTTAPCYRFYALAGGPPMRPGLVMDENEGAAIDVEIWRMPLENFGSFVAGIASPLGIGKVKVADGREVVGFICEPRGLEGATEITHLGNWRTYMRSVQG